MTRTTMRAAAPRALLIATAVALACYLVTGLAEAMLIRLLRPSEMELDWISDALLSTALGVAVYLWLHLRATRDALTERERSQLVLQTQLSLAEAMQRRLLPAVPPPSDGFEWAAMLTPAGKIGGDFFDFYEPAPGVRLVLVADVSGKGIAAAMALTLLRSTFRSVARETNCPSRLAARMSTAFYDEWHGSPYVTAVIARLETDPRALTYTNAGHPRGLLVRDGQARGLAEGGPPLGLLEDTPFAEERVGLMDGDVCAFVTDGVSEALDDGRPWPAAVLDAMRRVIPSSAGGVCEAIVSLAQSGHGPGNVEDWTDDRTVVVVRVEEER